MRPFLAAAAATLLLAQPLALCPQAHAAGLDLSGVEPTAAIRIAALPGGSARVEWPVQDGARCVAVFRVEGTGPLIESLAIHARGDSEPTLVARELSPFVALTVGTRNLDTPGGWTIFFDKVHERPHQRHAAELSRESARAIASGARGSIAFQSLSAGPFRGELVFSFFAGSPLILMEAALRTDEDRRAILYDAGLVAQPGAVERFVWTDHDGEPREQPAVSGTAATPRAVRFRVVAAETPGGALAVFPPPHRFFYPLDFADNFGFNWLGRDYDLAPPGDGWGIRQPPEGDRRFVPWINAPPGSVQRLGAFCLLSAGDAEAAITEVRRYTNSDRYPRLAGHRTFTSHYHVEHTLELLRRQAAGEGELPPDLILPSFVKVFREAGVDIAHLAEFHVGQTPRLATDERLRQLRTLHVECRRLSNDNFLLLPGEEPNVHLGGHWISLFPRPVLWVLNRPEGAPFATTSDQGETIYHVGDAADVLELMRRERGLMWTAHPRIKSSLGFPDSYRDAEFYRSPQFLGAAWKAMPADCSRDSLGWRALDLLDDMNNWGPPKQLLGEVDVFQVRPGYEFYGHANVNYVRLERLPRFDEGWAPLLDSLRQGHFFTTTGEILFRDFEVRRRPGLPPTVRTRLSWTFPLDHLEVVGGDGSSILRHRVDLSGAPQHGEQEWTLELPPQFAKVRWLRLEAWDVAVNGAFVQPWQLAEGRR